MREGTAMAFKDPSYAQSGARKNAGYLAKESSNPVAGFGRARVFYFPSIVIDFLRRVVYVAVGFLPKLPYNGTVLRFLESIEPQGRSVH
jgi:hypothetical protein